MNIKRKISAIQRKKLSAAVSLALTAGHVGGALAQEGADHAEDQIVEIVVTAAFQESEADTALPVGVLAGEALREKIGTVSAIRSRTEIGMANASFGTGVGLPVIRGQSGNRVKFCKTESAFPTLPLSAPTTPTR